MFLQFKKWLYFFLVCILCFNCKQGIAQPELSVGVHVNRLPQGTYPTKLYQFSNTPGLVMVTITNHTGSAYTIYLNGSLTGDNGVQITTAKGYQPATINLKAFEIRTLNAVEAGNLFDPNSLVYLSGSSSVKPSVFGEQGLPEGTYQVCIRAFDASTHKPLSDEDPIGCSNIFTISTLEPPTILNPMNEDSVLAAGPQNIPFRWTTPPGAPPSTEYTIRLVEIFGDRNSNDAMRSATTPFFETTVRGIPVLLYSLQYPQMKVGRSYAMMVTASDPSGGVTFRNSGRSEVIQFAYGRVVATAISNTMSANGIAICSDDCKMPITDSKVKRDLAAIQPGSKLNIDGFDLVITRIDNNNNGMLSGEGKIQVPVLKFIPVSVSFKNLQINGSNQVIEGTAVGKRRSDAASLLPDYDPMNPNLTIDPNKVQNFGQYISNYIASNLDPQQSLGYSLPLGISSVSSYQVTIAVTNIVFTPQQAFFDAGAAFEIPEASMTVALGGRGICFSKDKTLCGQAQIYLEKDIDIATTGIALKAADATDLGTYIEFGPDGFKRLRIRGEYSFPEGLFEKKGGGVVKAQLTVEAAESWANWIASVSIDAFHIKGDDNFGFIPGTAYYDHSDKENPAGIPSYYEEVIAPTWRGFFIPEMQVELPAMIKKFANNDRLIASARDFIIDAQGLSGTFGIDNLLTIDEGALSSWQFSVDRIEAVFKKNSFTEGNMKGRILLPIANADDPNSQLDYTCALGIKDSLTFQFNVKPKDNIDVPMWIVHMNIDKSSSVRVTVGDGFKVSAVLTGNLSFQPKLPGLGSVDIKAISFENLTINSSEPYISDGRMVTGQSSPLKFLNGFPVSFREPPKLSPNKLGLVFSIDVTLADIPSIPKASTTFTVTGGFDLVNGRLRTQAPKFFIDEISLNGWVGPVRVNGTVRFVDNDPRFGDGIEGVIREATFPPGFTVRASAFFGKKDYHYFFVGASFNLPPPAIPIGGGIIPLSIFGFGGGVYYNMSLKQEPMVVNRISEADPMSMYSPAQGITGFRGSVTLGSSDGSVFVAMGTLSTEIDRTNMTIHKLAINIDAGMYTTLAELSSAMIQGAGFIQYDFAQEEFTAGVRMDINLPGGFIKGSGTLGLLTNFKSGDWYFKMGDAAPGGSKVTLSLSAFNKVKFDFQAYQNLGNNLRLPARLQSVYDAAAGRLITTDSYTNPVTLQTQPVTKVAGVLFGASASAGMDLEFLIFYLKMKAELGFDLALLQDARKCDNGDQLGLNGYYAIGDLYASGSFDFGLNVNVWFFKGKVSAAKVGFSTTLQAGFANPFMFDGWLEADYSVLEGLVTGHMNFHVKYSSAGEGGCILTSNPFAGMPLISDIVPHDGDQDVSVFVSTGSAFNFPVNEEFTMKVRNDKGEDELKKLKVVINSFSLTNNKTGQVYSASMDVNGNNFTVQNGGQINASSHNAWLYGWAKTLDPQSSFTVSVVADGYEWNLEGGWKKIDAATDTKTASFKTGDCIQSLSEQGAVLASYPFQNQRYFLPKNYTNGYIYLKLATDCLQNPPPKKGGPQEVLSAAQIVRYDLYALFDSEKDHLESPITNDGQLLNFNIPEQIAPSTVYRLRIVKRPVIGQSALVASLIRIPSDQNNITLKQVSIVQSPADQANSNVMKNSLFIQDHAAIAALSTAMAADIEIYSYYFRTSRFRTIQEKTLGLVQEGAANWGSAWGGTGPIPSFNLNVREGMDEYDAKGLFVEGVKNNIAQTRNGTNVFIPPVFNLDEDYYSNPWMEQVIFPITQQYTQIAPFDIEQSQHSKWRLLAPVGGNTMFLKDMEPFQVNGYEAPLNPGEIPMALKVQNFMVAPNLGISRVTQPGMSNPPKNPTQMIKQ